MDLLNTGTAYRLVLVIAPQGSGRTKLLKEWAWRQAEDQGLLVAWLHLEETDNNPEYFLADLDQALRKILPPTLIQPDLRSFQFSSTTTVRIDALELEGALAERINVLAQAPGRLVLVLDRYDAIESAEVHQAVGLLLDYLPPQALVLIACTSEPPLPLARLRVRRQLLELTFEDLV